MGYVSPSSKSTGVLVTASHWNQDVVDNVFDLDARAHELAAVRQPVIINGSMQVSRKYASKVSLASGDHLATCWKYEKSGAVVQDYAQSSSSPGAAATRPYNPSSLQLTVTTADTSISGADRSVISHKIEGYNFARIAQRQFTLSFWIRSTVTGTYCVAFRNSGVDRSFLAEYTIDSANTWEYKTITVSASPSAGTWDYTSGIGLNITWALACGSTLHGSVGWNSANVVATSNQVNAVATVGNAVHLTNVQIDVGAQALDFCLFPWNTEVLWVSRYFVAWITNEAGFPTYFGIGVAVDGDDARITVVTPVEMRAEPTAEASGLSTAPSGGTMDSLVTYTKVGNTVTVFFRNTTSVYSGGDIVFFEIDQIGEYLYLDATL